MLLLSLSLLSACAAHRSAEAKEIIDTFHLAGGWAPCHGAPGSCTARITLGPEEQDPEGRCYQIVVKAPEEADVLSLEVYADGDPTPIAESDGPSNPAVASLCMESQDPPEPLDLRIIVPHRVPDGASAAIFRD